MRYKYTFWILSSSHYKCFCGGGICLVSTTPYGCQEIFSREWIL